jgi:hypothetical protein
MCTLHWFPIVGNADIIVSDMIKRFAVDSEECGGAAGNAKGFAAAAGERGLYRVWISCSVLVSIPVDRDASVAWTPA